MYVDVDRHPLAMVQNKSGATMRTITTSSTKSKSQSECCTSSSINASHGPCNENEEETCVMRKIKSVRFEEKRNEYFASFHENKGSCVGLWAGKEDYRHFKQSTQEQAREISKAKKPYRRHALVWRQSLERCYKALLNEAVETLEDDEYDFETSLLTAVEQRNLRSVYSGSAIPLGLEHLIVDLIAQERHGRRFEQVDRVFQIEETIDFPCPDMERQFIRLTSESVSLTPRLFAREVAMALAAEVNKLPDLAFSDDSSEGSSDASSCCDDYSTSVECCRR